MTLKQAYRISLNGEAKKLGLARQTLANRRAEAKGGRFPSEKSMRLVVKKAGMRKVADEQWA